MARRGEDIENRYLERKDKKKLYSNQLPTEDDPPLPPPVETIRSEDKKPRRNDPCPCGSGKKYKQCCAKKT